ncbi:unnamed protein product, partial [Prorocentrum cordatum]
MEGRAARARALRPGVWLPAELRGPREGLLHARGAARAGRGAPAAQRAQAGAPWPGQGRLADELPQRASDMLQSALRAMEPAWRCEVHLAPEQLSGPARGAAMLAATEVWAVEVAELLESCPSWDTAQAWSGDGRWPRVRSACRRSCGGLLRRCGKPLRPWTHGWVAPSASPTTRGSCSWLGGTSGAEKPRGGHLP